MKLFIGFAAILGISVLFMWTQTPQLWLDLTTRSSAWSVASDLRMDDLDCTRYQHIVTRCSVDWHSVTAPEHGTVRYVFFGEPDLHPTLLRAEGSPGAVTTDDALAGRVGRTIVWGFMAFLLWVCLTKSAQFLRDDDTPPALAPPTAPDPSGNAAPRGSSLRPASVVTRRDDARPVFGRRG
jgi:hypothetical protein